MRLLTELEFRRFASKVVVVEQGPWRCWEWIGKRDRYGYARFWLDGAWRSAHRLAFVAVQADRRRPTPRARRRTIPADRPQLDHRCENESCVRPSHLKPVTQTENQRLRVLRNPKYKHKRCLEAAS